MHVVRNISLVQVLTGALIMYFSIGLGLKIRRDVPPDLRKKWLVAVNIMVFFLISYLLAAFILQFDIIFPLEIVTATVFLAGAIFVYTNMKLSRETIQGIIEKDREIEEYTEKMSKRAAQLVKENARRRKTEKLLVQSKQDWENTFDTITDIITIHDKDFNIIKANKAARNLLDLPDLDEFLNEKCYTYYHGTDSPPKGCPGNNCISKREQCDFEIYEPHLARNVEIRAIPRFDNNNQVTGMVHIARDVTERKEMEEQLQRLSLTDELTGLYNRRGFFILIEHQLKIAKRQNNRFMLLYADLDNFKDINDTLGHKEGDLVLIEAANILKETYRESDIVARIGGDEFVVFPAGSSEDNMGTIYDRLQRNIDTHNDKMDRVYNLSMSIGIAAYDPDSTHSIDELLARADRLMYENKKQKKKAASGI